MMLGDAIDTSGMWNALLIFGGIVVLSALLALLLVRGVRRVVMPDQRRKSKVTDAESSVPARKKESHG